MCCMNVSCDNCPVNLEWTLIYQQRINPTKKKKFIPSDTVNPPLSPFRGRRGEVFISNTFEGGLNRDGGRI